LTLFHQTVRQSSPTIPPGEGKREEEKIEKKNEF